MGQVLMSKMPREAVARQIGFSAASFGVACQKHFRHGCCGFNERPIGLVKIAAIWRNSGGE